MSKVVKLTVYLILVSLLFTCKMFHADYDSVSSNYKDSSDNGLFISEDGKYATIYLDGQLPVSSGSRALSKNNAFMGHDYYEVAFFHPNTNTIARAAWGLKENANVNGVYRTDSGIDYGYVNPANALAANRGAAILFVGKKTDKTLLAVGKLTDAKDGDGISTGTTINNDTVSVTFTVDALKSGVNINAVDSSFQTASGDIGNYTNVTPGHTDVTSLGIAGKNFPLFKLAERQTVKAHYKFDVHNGTNGNFDYYRQGIILAGKGTFMNKQPRYPIQNGEFQSYSVRLDERTVIAPVNNLDADIGSPFANPVEFSFDTANTIDGSVFALVFEIPVYPLSALEDLGKWYMRASYDSYWLDLDDGNGGTGGAVLIGTGDVTAGGGSGYEIKVVTPPVKWQYAPPPSTLGLDFDITGLVVKLRDAITHAELETIDNSELFFELAYNEIVSGQDINEYLYGLQTVFVNYRKGGIIYTDSFNIVCASDDGPDYTNIFDDNYLLIQNANWASINPGSRGPQTIVLVATGSYNFTGAIWMSGGPHLIMIVAAKPWPNYPAPNTTPDPTIIIGRTVNNGPFIASWDNYDTKHAFFFGRWPGPYIIIGGNYYEPCDYILNAGGSFAEVTVTPGPPTAATPSVTGYFCTVQSPNGRFYLVTQANGATILNEDSLY